MGELTSTYGTQRTHKITSSRWRRETAFEGPFGPSEPVTTTYVPVAFPPLCDIGAPLLDG